MHSWMLCKLGHPAVQVAIDYKFTWKGYRACTLRMSGAAQAVGGGGRSKDPQAVRGSLEQSTVSRARNSSASSRLSLSFSEEMLLLELEHGVWMMAPGELDYTDLLPGALLPSLPTDRLLELAMLPEQRELSLLKCSGVEKLLE